MIKVKYTVLEPVLDFRKSLDNKVLVHPEECLLYTSRGYKPLQETVSQAGVQMRPDGCEHEH